MDSISQKFRDWFRSLQPRERVIVAAGAVIVVFVAIYFGLAPFYKSLHLRAERVERKQSDLAWIRSVAPEVQALGAGRPIGTGPTGESLVVLVDRTARECGLGTSLTGQTPNGENGIRVRLEDASFDVLVKCLGNLQQTQSIGIESASFDRTGKPGMVNANLILNRAGS
ncbi:MAG TPA: type II secretion system protein M [Povalibacter sp.]|jgi:general secretion pathway protein M